ncbi:hypothetical protein ACTFO3_26865 [Bacillus cereus group sp. MYBK69-2]|uniref:hypothetical protein n=1 Tax=unclassified Bacillus cereus group TaxID=2750818 RepID=UPI003F797B6E
MSQKENELMEEQKKQWNEAFNPTNTMFPSQEQIERNQAWANNANKQHQKQFKPDQDVKDAQALLDGQNKGENEQISAEMQKQFESSDQFQQWKNAF